MRKSRGGYELLCPVHAGDYDGVFPQGDGYIAKCPDDKSLCIPTFIASDGWKLQAMMKTHNAQLATSLLPLGTSLAILPLWASTLHIASFTSFNHWNMANGLPSHCLPTVYLHTVYQWFEKGRESLKAALLPCWQSLRTKTILEDGALCGVTSQGS